MKSKRTIINKILNDRPTSVLSIGSPEKLCDYNVWNLDEIILNQRSSIQSEKEDLFVDSNAAKSNMIDVAVLDLIKKVKSSIPIEQVQARCKQQPDIDKIAKVDFEQGDLVTHNDQVAFKLDYKISYKLCLLLDRKGNLIMDFPESLNNR